MTRYTVPTVAQLCTWLGVTHRTADPIPAGAAHRTSDTGAALVQALITRCAGQRERGTAWQAGVFGVSKTTIRRWRKRAGVQTVSLGQRILPSAFRYVFPDEARIPEDWLQDETGKRYPAQRVVAAVLMKRGHTVTYHTRADYVFYPGAVGASVHPTVGASAPAPSVHPTAGGHAHGDAMDVPISVTPSVHPLAGGHAHGDAMDVPSLVLPYSRPDIVGTPHQRISGGTSTAPDTLVHPMAGASAPDTPPRARKFSYERSFKKKFWEVFRKSQHKHIHSGPTVLMGQSRLWIEEYNDLVYMVEAYEARWQGEFANDRVDRARIAAGYRAFDQVRDFLLAEQFPKKRTPQRTTRPHRRPLKEWCGLDMEAKAKELRLNINILIENDPNTDKSRRMSLQTARWLVSTNPVAAHRAFDALLDTLNKGRVIRNMVGWLVKTFKALC